MTTQNIDSPIQADERRQRQPDRPARDDHRKCEDQERYGHGKDQVKKDVDDFLGKI